MRFFLLALVALSVLLVATTCTRGDEAALKCPPLQQPYYCQMECMARRCDGLAWMAGIFRTSLCADDPMDAMLQFAAAVRDYEIKDCGPPSCQPIVDTGSAVVPAGSGFQEQGETESGATGGWWEPVPGEGCIP